MYLFVPKTRFRLAARVTIAANAWATARFPCGRGRRAARRSEPLESYLPPAARRLLVAGPCGEPPDFRLCCELLLRAGLRRALVVGLVARRPGVGVVAVAATLAGLVLGLGCATATAVSARDDAGGGAAQGESEHEEHWNELRPHWESLPSAAGLCLRDRAQLELVEVERRGLVGVLLQVARHVTEILWQLRLLAPHHRDLVRTTRVIPYPPRFRDGQGRVRAHVG